MAADTAANPALVLSESYRRWLITGRVPSTNVEGSAVLHALRALDVTTGAGPPPEECLFAAQVASGAGEHRSAARWYVAAFSQCALLRDVDDFQDLQFLCQLEGNSLNDAFENGALPDVIEDMVLQALQKQQRLCDAVEGGDDHSLGRARKAAVEQWKQDLRAATWHLFSKLRDQCNGCLKVQPALFLVDACWARAYGATAFPQQPEAWDEGPVYCDARDLVDEWLRATSSAGLSPPGAVPVGAAGAGTVSDVSAGDGARAYLLTSGGSMAPELQKLLDTAIAFATAHTAAELGALTRAEPVWLASKRNQVIDEARIVAAGKTDARGTLGEVFGACAEDCEATRL